MAPFCAVLPWLGGGVKWAAKMEQHADPGLCRPVQVPSNAHCRMMLHPACTAAHPCNATQLPQGLFVIAQRDIRIIPKAVLVAFRWVVVGMLPVELPSGAAEGLRRLVGRACGLVHRDAVQLFLQAHIP